MSVIDLVRPELASMRPYSAAEQLDDTIRLNANEAPWSVGDRQFRRPLNRYPQIRPASLRRALAERFGCTEAALLVTRGSSEGIDLLIRAFCRAGKDGVLTTTPSFSMYAHYAQIQDARVTSVPLDRAQDFRLDAQAVLDACDDSTRLVFLCTPNNPTGTSIEPATIEKIIDASAGRFVVVIDEAYIEFSDAASCTRLMDRHDNLVVLRTLSKALAFAGARCGAVIADPDIIAVLDAIQAPYALSTPVVECVEDALGSDSIDEAGKRVSETIAQRRELAAALERLSFVRRVWPSDANFLLVAFEDAQAVMRASRDKGILLRQFGGELADCIRISVGTEAENHALLDSLRAMEAAA